MNKVIFFDKNENKFKRDKDRRHSFDEQIRSSLTRGRDVRDMDLCHFVPYAEIAELIVNYLNGEVTDTTFSTRTGSLYYATWGILFSMEALVFFQQWLEAIMLRRCLIKNLMDLNAARNATARDNENIAELANQFLYHLNSSICNLDYGHSSTNRSIGNGVDLVVLDHPSFLDPFQICSGLVSKLCFRSIFSPQSSYLINVWNVQTFPLAAGNGIKSSFGNSVVGRTGTGNDIMGYEEMPLIHSRIISGQIPGIPLSNESIWLLVLFLLFCQFAGAYPIQGMQNQITENLAVLRIHPNLPNNVLRFDEDTGENKRKNFFGEEKRHKD